ncbi:hypothetical protein [Natrarchaeobaculum aegyptiacum]|nr:hypothetical protein [Natrarchaeobaculum aegyptiacum]
MERGDRHHLDETGTLSADVVSQRFGAFAELEPIDIGTETDAAGDHDLVGTSS